MADCSSFVISHVLCDADRYVLLFLKFMAATAAAVDLQNNNNEKRSRP